jgi:hypothetical protein
MLKQNWLRIAILTNFLKLRNEILNFNYSNFRLYIAKLLKH